MFYKSRDNVILSNENFSVAMVGNYCLRYNEKGQDILVSFKWSITKPGSIVVQERDFIKLGPDSSILPVDSETKKHSIANISRAMEWAGIHVEYDPSPAGNGQRSTYQNIDRIAYKR